MLSSYRVACPYEGCDWDGSLVPSLLQGGAEAEVAVMQRAWFHCPGCQRDWEVRVSGDVITAVSVGGRGSGPSHRKDSVPLATAPSRRARPKCRHADSPARTTSLQ